MFPIQRQQALTQTVLNVEQIPYPFFVSKKRLEKMDQVLVQCPAILTRQMRSGLIDSAVIFAVDLLHRPHTGSLVRLKSDSIAQEQKRSLAVH